MKGRILSFLLLKMVNLGDMGSFVPIWATQTSKDEQWGKFKFILDSNINIFFQHICIHCLGSLRVYNTTQLLTWLTL